MADRRSKLLSARISPQRPVTQRPATSRPEKSITHSFSGQRRGSESSPSYAPYLKHPKRRPRKGGGPASCSDLSFVSGASLIDRLSDSPTSTPQKRARVFANRSRRGGKGGVSLLDRISKACDTESQSTEAQESFRMTSDETQVNEMEAADRAILVRHFRLWCYCTTRTQDRSSEADVKSFHSCTKYSQRYP
jgi:hypothetical protein